MSSHSHPWAHYLTCAVVLVGMSVAICRGEVSLALPLIALLVASTDRCRPVATSGLRGFVAGGSAALALAYAAWIQQRLGHFASYELGALVMAVAAFGCCLCLAVSGFAHRRLATALVATVSLFIFACGLTLPAVQ